MTLQPFKDEELNYFKFASLVLNEFPKALRQTFKSMWDNNFRHLSLWNDSMLVRNLLRTKEGGTTKVPTNLSYEKWDCTALFQATIYAYSFALPDSKGHHKTLSDLYVKPHKLGPGKFHAYVMSPGGNTAETLALAIDQLRLLRNFLCHSASSEIIKPTFDLFVQLSKDAFKALGVMTDPIDAIGGLTESNFPTKEVGKLRQALTVETMSYLKFLEAMCSEIHELTGLSTAIKGEVESTATKEDIASLKQEINDLKQVLAQDKQDTKPSLSKPCLPPMVPNFTGRQKECDEITGHVTSGSTRIVSIWGSPGFGKTSVAIAVGHHLHSQGLLVHYLSLRGLQSTADLASQFLSLFGRPAAAGQQNPQRLPIDDEVFKIFSKMSDPFTIILDNVDGLLSGGPKMKENFTHFLTDILRRTEKVTFVVTARESLEFLNVQFQGHQAVRISPLDAQSSQNLVDELLPNASTFNRKRVTKICGNVPLAMKLLCSSISEDNAELIQVLGDLSIVEMLDNPDDPENLRLKHLFDSSFKRLSVQEKEALVSLCVLPDSIDPTIAAAVLGMPQIPVAKMVLRNLRRKSLLESSAKPGSFLMHPLTRSFVHQRGEQEMKETVLQSKARLRAFYIRRFKDLNEKFLTGHSMSAFIDFYKDEQSIIQSLIEGCLDSKTANSVFEVLVEAELFLYSIYWKNEITFTKIYESAINEARKLEKNVFCRQLFVSKALYHVTWSPGENKTGLLSEASPSPVSAGEGKHLCYSGINQLVNGEKATGVKCLEDALPFLNSTPEKKVLRIIALQILAIYYRFRKDCNAVQECRKLENTQLLVIPGIESTGIKVDEEGMTQVPLKVVVLSLVSEATKHLTDNDTRRSIGNVAKQIAGDIEKPPVQRSVGLFIFQWNANVILQHVSRGMAVNTGKMKKTTASCHETELSQFKRAKSCRTSRKKSSTNDCRPSTINDFSFGNPALLSQDRSAELAKEQRSRTVERFYQSLEDKQNGKQEGPFPVLRSEQRAHGIKQKLFGEGRSSTADSYDSLSVTQHAHGDVSPALQSSQRALNLKLAPIGEEHSSTADSYDSLSVTQHAQRDFDSALQSAQRALDIRLALFGEQHSSTADSYDSLSVTQHAQGNFSSALQSAQRSLDIRLALFGEQHSSTADSYNSLGITQYALGDFSSALQCIERALDIRRKLFGEEHSSTADSYDSLSVTQHAQGDFNSALQSAQRALDIRLAQFGEEHSSTADSYYSLSVTQHAQRDFDSALQSTQRALDIRLALFGEKHSSTADSYDSRSVIQHAQRDFDSALQSAQRALDIRLALFGEEHSSTADSYDSLSVIQQAQALQFKQRALNIRRKLKNTVNP